MGRHRNEDGLYSEAEARICLTFESKRCIGICDRLREERKRLYKESLPSPLYEIDDEYTVPEEAPWPKENPHIKRKD